MRVSYWLALAGMVGAATAYLASLSSWAIHVPAVVPAVAAIGVALLGWSLLYRLWPGRRLLNGGVMLSAGLVALWCTVALLPDTSGGHVTLHVRAAEWWVMLPALATVVACLLLSLEHRRIDDGLVRSEWPLLVMAAGLGMMGTTLLFFGSGEAAQRLGGDGMVPYGTPLLASTSATQADPALAAGAIDPPRGFPPMRIPADNPPTPAGIELGRYLFYDPRLSGQGTQSCSSCHLQELAFSDGKATPIGSTGDRLLRNSPALVNVGYNATLTWAHPGLVAIEKQVLIPLFAEFPVEMGASGREETILARLRADARYQRLFADAFPDDPEPVTLHNLVLALSTFVRSLVSGDSAYDRYLAGETQALSPSALRGMEMFFSERFECHHCHSGFNFTASTVHANSTFSSANFQNNGLYNVDGAGGYPLGNRGVYEITANGNDMGRFRPPTLRNIALTAPYMHDGSIATLEEVIRHYARGGRVIETGADQGDGRISPLKSPLVPGFEIRDQELADLAAFLTSLTDETFVTNPKFSNPFTDPVGQAISALPAAK